MVVPAGRMHLETMSPPNVKFLKKCARLENSTAFVEVKSNESLLRALVV